jgi:hypothetical protein
MDAEKGTFSAGKLNFRPEKSGFHFSARARIYRPSFRHENARFHENKQKMLVFNPIGAQRRHFQLVLKR